MTTGRIFMQHYQLKPLNRAIQHSLLEAASATPFCLSLQCTYKRGSSDTITTSATTLYSTELRATDPLDMTRTHTCSDALRGTITYWVGGSSVPMIWYFSTSSLLMFSALTAMRWKHPPPSWTSYTSWQWEKWSTNNILLCVHQCCFSKHISL